MELCVTWLSDMMSHEHNEAVFLEWVTATQTYMYIHVCVTLLSNTDMMGLYVTNLSNMYKHRHHSTMCNLYCSTDIISFCVTCLSNTEILGLCVTWKCNTDRMGLPVYVTGLYKQT